MGNRITGLTSTNPLASGEGDCEDYVIAKLQLFRALGYSARDLYIMIVRDLAQDQDHAVLVVVRSGERLRLLDNQRDDIADPAQLTARNRGTVTAQEGGMFADLSLGKAVKKRKIRVNFAHGPAS